MISEGDDSCYVRLEQQIDWYDSKSGFAQKYYKRTKYFTISAAALIPIIALSGLPYSEWLIAVTGSLIAILEGANHLNQWQHNWITYRSTCEALRHEKYTFMAGADPYDFDEEKKHGNFLPNV